MRVRDQYVQVESPEIEMPKHALLMLWNCGLVLVLQPGLLALVAGAFSAYHLWQLKKLLIG